MSHFNSMNVRLKGFKQVIPYGIARDFNSMNVRLKVMNRAKYPDVVKFQFNECAIKSLLQMINAGFNPYFNSMNVRLKEPRQGLQLSLQGISIQ